MPLSKLVKIIILFVYIFVKRKSEFISEDLKQKNTLAASYSHRGKPPTTIGAEELNFRVRHGNGCDLFAIATSICPYAFISWQNEHVSGVTGFPFLLYVPQSGHVGIIVTSLDDDTTFEPPPPASLSGLRARLEVRRLKERM